MNIAYDLDDTLYLILPDGSQVPNYDLIQVLRWFYHNGDHTFVWSAGGVEYAQHIVAKLGLQNWVKVIPKGAIPGQLTMDITFDDMPVALGRVNIKVNKTT